MSHTVSLAAVPVTGLLNQYQFRVAHPRPVELKVFQLSNVGVGVLTR